MAVPKSPERSIGTVPPWNVPAALRSGAEPTCSSSAPTSVASVMPGPP